MLVMQFQIAKFAKFALQCASEHHAQHVAVLLWSPHISGSAHDATALVTRVRLTKPHDGEEDSHYTD